MNALPQVPGDARHFHRNAGGFSLLAFNAGAILRTPKGIFAAPTIADLAALRDALSEAVEWHQSRFPQVQS